MRLMKTETTPLLTYPIRPESANPQDSFARLTKLRPKESTATPTHGALASLIDLVANHRSDLLKTFLGILAEADGSCEQAEALTDLVAACGVAEASSPCATAIAIAEDLDKLLEASGHWTHPAQIVERPNAQALYKLCEQRLEGAAAGNERERLSEILPRLERAARLTEKAALRRVQESVRQRH